MKHNSITTIKCRFSNQVNKMINPYFGVKRSNQWKKKVVKLTDEEKIKLFDEIYKLNMEISEEISSGLYKRREKKRVINDRIKRQCLPKGEEQKN